MKRLLAVVAGVSLLGLGARAEEKVEKKAEAKINDDGTGHTKVTKKHKHGKATDTTEAEHKVSKDMGGGTTETMEMKSKHDAPGTAHDMKTEKKETVKRDAQGNVIKHEKTEEAK